MNQTMYFKCHRNNAWMPKTGSFHKLIFISALKVHCFIFKYLLSKGRGGVFIHL